ncbi:MAG: hypothetical protein JW969_18320 [Spirochaetales bacterium]|nr:hypothetical protein [Spirochaetales bacterium]
MKNKIFIISALLFVFFIFHAFGESIAYVDMEQAKNEISEKKAANAELSKSISSLNAENTQLNKEVEAYYRLMVKIDWLLYRINPQLEKMEQAVNSIEDTSYNSKINELYQQNLAAKNDLIQRREDLQTKINGKKEKISENEQSINRLSEEKKANEDRIVYLEIALEKTEDLETRMAAYVKEVESLKTEMEKEISEIEGTTVPEP